MVDSPFLGIPLGKERFKFFDVFFAMFSDRKLSFAPQADIPLLEELEDGVESHFVSGVEGGFEEFPGGNRVLSADSSYEAQRRKKLVFRQQNWGQRRRKRRYNLQ